MSDITLRLVKGSPLTNQEVDDNFANLNTDKYESGDSASFQDLTLDGMSGPLTWNVDEGTLDVPLNAQVTLQAGQEFVFYAKATEAINNGDVVMFAGAQGGHLLIAKCDMGAVGFDPSHIVGVATQSFANNEFGYVTSIGKVRDLDTSAYTEGTILYVDPTTVGAFTTTIPSPPAHIVQTAVVTRSHATEGTLLVRVSHMPDTDEIPEGSTNLYFTDARAVSAIKADGDWNATNWDTAYGWGDHSLVGYSTTDTTYSVGDGGLTEKNFTTALKTKLDGIATNANNYVLPFTDNSTNWNTAYGWGDHSTQSYATQTYVNNAVSNLVDSAPSTLDTLNELAAALGDDPNFAATVTNSIGTKWTQDNTKISNWDTAYSWGNHASAGYLTSFTETDPTVPSHVKTITTTQIGNWTTAYNWGNHASANYAVTTGDTFTGVMTFNSRIHAKDTINLGATDTSSDQLATNNGTDIFLGTSAKGLKTYSHLRTSSNQYYFHEGYHPNADKWTTARTNTVTLTGDATGSGNASVDGSGNWTVSVPVTVANDSHNHDHADGDFSVYGDLKMAGTDSYIWTPSPSTGFTGLWDQPNGRQVWRYQNDVGDLELKRPTKVLVGWGAGNNNYPEAFTIQGTFPSYTLRSTNTNAVWLQHMEGDGDLTWYYGANFAEDNWAKKLELNKDGNLYHEGNSKFWHAGNDGSGSGLDADTIDGKHASEFVYQLGSTASPNYQTPSSRRVDPNGSNPTNAHHAISTFGNNDNVTGQLATHFVSGEAYTRAYNSSWSGWRKQWDASNDGSGSGLDADLLDGNHASAFALSHGHPYLSNATDSEQTAHFGIVNWNQNSARVNSDPRINESGYDSDSVNIHWWTTTAAGANYGRVGHALYNGTAYQYLHTKASINNLYHNNNVIWTSSNDGSGSGLDADLLDGKDHTNFGATLATYGTTGSTSRIRCTAPFNTNSGKMFQVTVSLYTGYTSHTYVVSAYMYSSTNQWHSPKAIYTGSGSPDIVVGRDANGKAYISIGSGSYTGVRVHSMTRGFYTSVADTYAPWTITSNSATENSVAVSVYNAMDKGWHSGNDGSGSGLDADLLDGQHASAFAPASHSHSYLPLSGGTVTGNVTLSGSGNSARLTLGGSRMISVTGSSDVVWQNLGQLRLSDRANYDWNDWAGIKYSSANQALYIGGPASSVFSSNSSPPSVIINFDGVSDIRHNGTTVIGSDRKFQFTRASSGTLASRTGFSDFIGYNPSYGSYIGGGVSNAGNYIYAGGYISKNGIHTLWHSGNDGSGSGLDADLLDGLQASAFINTSSKNASGWHKCATTGVIIQWARIYVTANSTTYWTFPTTFPSACRSISANQESNNAGIGDNSQFYGITRTGATLRNGWNSLATYFNVFAIGY